MDEEKPDKSSQAIIGVVMVILKVILIYCVVFGIWGFALNKNIFWFALFGIIFGFFIILLSVFPVIAKLRTIEQTKDMMLSAKAIWSIAAILIGFLGMITWIIRTIFF